MNFEQAVNYVLTSEGGYVNNPNDAGGETKYGISKRAFPGEDIKNLTVARAKFLYKTHYWDLVRADELPSKLRYTVFDFAVNAGVPTAIKTLQRAGGSKRDGIIGKNTIASAQKVTPDLFAEMRIRHYTGIVKAKPKQIEFLDGWNIRTLHVTLRCILND